MAVLALVLILTWLLVVAVLRGVRHAIRTGSLDVIAIRRQDRKAARWANSIASVGFVLTVGAPVAELVGSAPIAALDHTPLRAAGAAIVILGTIATFAAQESMGESWRVDVDPDVRVPLVTTGPFAMVRNPVFTAVGVTFVGFAVLVPHVLAAAMLVTVFGAIEMQVRLVEEPYLHRAHGREWDAYAARTGRFLPMVGRLQNVQ